MNTSLPTCFFKHRETSYSLAYLYGKDPLMLTKAIILRERERDGQWCYNDPAWEKMLYSSQREMQRENSKEIEVLDDYGCNLLNFLVLVNGLDSNCSRK